MMRLGGNSLELKPKLEIPGVRISASVGMIVMMTAMVRRKLASDSDSNTGTGRGTLMRMSV